LFPFSEQDKERKKELLLEPLLSLSTVIRAFRKKAGRLKGGWGEERVGQPVQPAEQEAPYLIHTVGFSNFL
jgi:hypothetical protein